MHSLYAILKWVAALGGLLMAAAIGYRFGVWTARTLWQLGVQFASFLSDFLIHAASISGKAIRAATIATTVFIAEVLVTGVLWLMMPALTRIGKGLDDARRQLRMARAYLFRGRHLHPSFAAFKQHLRDEEELKEFATDGDRNAAGKTEYEAALEVLGLRFEKSFTPETLKQRYRKLMDVVHRC